MKLYDSTKVEMKTVSNTLAVLRNGKVNPLSRFEGGGQQYNWIINSIFGDKTNNR